MGWRSGADAYDPQASPQHLPDLLSEKKIPGILSACKELHPKEWAKRQGACRACRRKYDRAYYRMHKVIKDLYTPVNDPPPSPAEKRAVRMAEAERIMLAAGAKPLTVYTSGRKPWSAECLNCGALIAPRLDNVKRGHNPCKYCGNSKRNAHKNS